MKSNETKWITQILHKTLSKMKTDVKNHKEKKMEISIKYSTTTKYIRIMYGQYRKNIYRMSFFLIFFGAFMSTEIIIKRLQKKKYWKWTKIIVRLLQNILLNTFSTQKIIITHLEKSMFYFLVSLNIKKFLLLRTPNLSLQKIYDAF
jgi:hypothetical protein